MVRGQIIPIPQYFSWNICVEGTIPSRIPQGFTPRKLESLITGKAYSVTSFVKEKSKFPSKNNEPVFKTVALYTDFRVKFYTYLPKDFDGLNDEDIKKYNNDMKNGRNIRINCILREDWS